MKIDASELSSQVARPAWGSWRRRFCGAQEEHAWRLHRVQADCREMLTCKSDAEGERGVLIDVSSIVALEGRS
jgi:hypothetical protein